MKNQFIKSIGASLSALLLLVTLNSCETWRQECTGEIIVENEIPDITLYVGGEPFTRDIFESPIVLSHTENRAIHITVSSKDGGIIVDANGRINHAKQEITIVEVIPKKAGNATVTITAEDGCDYNIQTSFNVTVVDTTTD